jgi:hypothetical protein
MVLDLLFSSKVRMGMRLILLLWLRERRRPRRGPKLGPSNNSQEDKVSSSRGI